MARRFETLEIRKPDFFLVEDDIDERQISEDLPGLPETPRVSRKFSHARRLRACRPLTNIYSKHESQTQTYTTKIGCTFLFKNIEKTL